MTLEDIKIEGNVVRILFKDNNKYYSIAISKVIFETIILKNDFIINSVNKIKEN